MSGKQAETSSGTRQQIERFPAAPSAAPISDSRLPACPNWESNELSSMRVEAIKPVTLLMLSVQRNCINIVQRTAYSFRSSEQPYFCQ
jgi:hypothetical protein